MAAESSGPRRGGDVLEDLLRKLKLSNVEKEGVFLAKRELGGLPKVNWMVGSFEERRQEQ